MAKPRRDIEHYLVYVDADRCDGCGDCAVLCAFTVFEVAHKASVVYPLNCMGCRTCEAVCKPDAIIITEI